VELNDPNILALTPLGGSFVIFIAL